MTWHPSPEYVERMEKRNGRIHELWAMGWTRKEIARDVGLTRSRVSQIVKDFGKEVIADTTSS